MTALLIALVSPNGLAGNHEEIDACVKAYQAVEAAKQEATTRALLACTSRCSGVLSNRAEDCTRWANARCDESWREVQSKESRAPRRRLQQCRVRCADQQTRKDKCAEWEAARRKRRRKPPTTQPEPPPIRVVVSPAPASHPADEEPPTDSAAGPDAPVEAPQDTDPPVEKPDDTAPPPTARPDVMEDSVVQPASAWPSTMQWFTMGGGVVLAGVGAGLWIWAENEADELRESPHLADEATQKAESAETYGAVGVVGVAAGSAALVAGVVWWLISDDETSVTLGVSPGSVTYTLEF